jgi:hypothetical protein
MVDCVAMACFEQHPFLRACREEGRTTAPTFFVGLPRPRPDLLPPEEELAEAVEDDEEAARPLLLPDEDIIKSVSFASSMFSSACETPAMRLISLEMAR